VKLSLQSVEPDLQHLEATLLLVAYCLAAISGGGSSAPMTADWAGESPLDRAYGVPEGGRMAGLVLPSRRPFIIERFVIAPAQRLLESAVNACLRAAQ
jgi:hypothetical protein